MNWTKLVLKAVGDVFASVEPILGTSNASSIVGVNPKGDKTYKIDKLAESVYLDKLPRDITIVSEESEKKPGGDAIVFLDPLCGSGLRR